MVSMQPFEVRLLKRKAEIDLNPLHAQIICVLLLLAETQDLDRMLAAVQGQQFPAEMLHVHSRPAVNMRRVFICY